MRKLSIIAGMLMLYASSSAYGETILVSGTNWGSPKSTGGFESEAVVLRYDGRFWLEAKLPTTATGYLYGVTYSASKTVWAYGASADDAPMLLRSQDDGQTWTDVTTTMPRGDARVVRPRGMAFVDELRGWMLGVQDGGGGPYLSQTTDGGRSWTPFEGRDTAIIGVFTLSVAEGKVYLLRTDTFGSFVEDLSNRDSRVKLGAPGEYHAEGLAYAAGKLWVAGFGAEDQRHYAVVTQVQPSSAPAGSDVSQMRTSGDVGQHLSTISFASDLRGLAGGLNQASDGSAQPLLLKTSDGGASWRRVLVPESAQGMVVTRASLSSRVGVVIANVEGQPGAALLMSSDDGESWDRIDTRLDRSGRLMGIASAP